MLFSVFYLSLFLSVGLLLARRAVPDGSAAVIVPLGCGFGVSLLAVLPALFAVVLGFTLPAVALAAAAAAGIGAALLYRGTRLRGMAKDPDSGALWACLLPVVLITLYLLHTHVLHLVDGAYHTGQSCYGDMPMHLGFIKYIAQSGEFLPRYPLLGGTHRFGYPFLCETVSSVFVVLGADLRTAYLLPMLPWLGLAAVCGTAWLCQMLPTVLAQSLDGQHMLRLHFNWINGQDDGTLRDNYFWFYIKNIGLVYLFLIPAFLRARPKQRWLYGGGLAILALAEFVVFQPNNYDNNKLLYVWHILGCILAAQLLVDIFAEVRALPWRALGLAACCFAGMFGSVLTVGREALSDYRQWSADDMALADYIDENAGSDALFLTSDSHLTPVFALAGRRILCGSGSYVYYHGMDYSAEYNAMRALYETPDEDTLAAWDIGYAVFDSSVYAKFAADESWYAARYDVWYENAACRVYKIKWHTPALPHIGFDRKFYARRSGYEGRP